MSHQETEDGFDYGMDDWRTDQSLQTQRGSFSIVNKEADESPEADGFPETDEYQEALRAAEAGEREKRSRKRQTRLVGASATLSVAEIDARAEADLKTENVMARRGKIGIIRDRRGL